MLTYADVCWRVLRQTAEAAAAVDIIAPGRSLEEAVGDAAHNAAIIRELALNSLGTPFTLLFWYKSANTDAVMLLAQVACLRLVPRGWMKRGRGGRGGHALGGGGGGAAAEGAEAGFAAAVLERRASVIGEAGVC
jgi:hypothetical protein